jgi:hypothetical protein
MMDAGVQDVAHGQHPDQLAAPDDRQVGRIPSSSIRSVASASSLRTLHGGSDSLTDPTMAPRPISRRSVAASRQITRCFFGHSRRAGASAPWHRDWEGPERDHAVAGGQVDLGAGVGERFPLARRMAGSSRTDQPKARLATASEDCSETAMGTTGPTMRRTP